MAVSHDSLLVLGATLLSLALAHAQEPEFTILEKQDARVEHRDKPGYTKAVVAKFRWRGGSTDFVATVYEDSCKKSSTYRSGVIGREDTSLRPYLSSFGDTVYEFKFEGPKPADRLFTTLCRSMK